MEPPKTTRTPGKAAGISEKVIRLLEVYKVIAQNQYPSAQDLAQRFGCSHRTIFRYLELVNMIDAVDYDPERKGYRFTHGDRIKKLTISDSELLVLLTAG